MNLSIITCTYNPNRAVFDRLISSVSKLKKTNNISVEWIVVDNNSKNKIEANFDFSNVKIPFSHVIERKPGLTAARISGINSAKGDWLVFFDDDNEPNNNYLIESVELILNYPKVKCWGAGNINVCFEDKNVNSWVIKQKKIFQERHVIGEIIQNSEVWNENYPQGTGQLIEKKIILDYLDKVDSGLYSLSDRKGKSLSSGGDVQIALNVIKKGYKVGVSEKLILNHNIESNKSTFEYINRLIYGMASGAIVSHQQVFPKKQSPRNISNLDVFYVFLNYLRQYKFKSLNKDNQLILAQRFGDLNAQNLASHKKTNPKLLEIFEKRYI
ncbi:glycosyltransferase family 2 protein [Winogradskyella undariae]|uniref:glycosyltransferase n=1 Tax=Winogradskyella undariae TaxID=1285465 RepID=UPI00156BA851|nr:glycosyltransferase [Winogradskyella undariae]NRR91023.1 glycosyltransferase family 2 protein [Winogradskyella undariae]